MNDFKAASNYFLPDTIRTLFIAESPPGNGSFFFFQFAKQEILLTSLTTALFGDGNGFDKTKDKVEFLKKFKNQGCFLTDAVSFPIAHLKNSAREKVIEKEYLNLQITLNKLIESGKFSKIMSKIILIKETVYNVLNKNLKLDGFNILNKKKIIFPRYYNDRNFIYDIRKLLSI